MKYLVITLITAMALIGWYLPMEHELGLGAISFPTSLDTLTNPTATTRTNVVSHAGQHSDANDAIEALQAKVGADGSAVTTSHTYKLSGVTGSDLACSLTGTETLTNKTLTSPNLTSASATNTVMWGTTTVTGTSTFTFNSNPFTLTGSALNIDLGSDATGDVYYRNSSGIFTRLAAGSDGQVLKLASGIPSWAADTAGASTLFRGYATTSQTINSTPTLIRFQDDYDTGSDHVYGTYTAPSTGYYQITGRINHNNARNVTTFIYVNGAASSTMGVGSSVTANDVAITDTLFLTAGDTVEIYALYIGSVTSVTVQSGITESYFSVVQL